MITNEVKVGNDSGPIVLLCLGLGASGAAEERMKILILCSLKSNAVTLHLHVSCIARMRKMHGNTYMYLYS